MPLTSKALSSILIDELLKKKNSHKNFVKEETVHRGQSRIL